MFAIVLAVLLFSVVLIGVSNAGTNWVIQTVDSIGIVGNGSSLALDSFNNPHITYYDSTNDDLKYASWTGSSWVIQTVDSTGDVGVDSSLALDSSDNPHISYHDFTNWDLKYARGQNYPPTGSIEINNGDAYSNSTNVTLDLTHSADYATVSEVRYSNDGTFDTEPWDTPAGSKAWILTSGDGEKTVYFQIRDSEGLLSSTYFDSIILDTTAPVCSVLINNDDAYATSNSVMLQLTYNDATSGVYLVRYANHDENWGDWEAPSPTKAWTLPLGDGVKFVNYQVMDNVGNISPQPGDEITLDTTAPAGSVSINSGDASTSSTSATLSLTYSDATSGVSQVRYSNDGAWDTEVWESPAATKAWTLTSGDGEKTVYYQIKDNAGLLSSTYSDTITLETPSPTPTPSPSPTPDSTSTQTPAPTPPTQSPTPTQAETPTPSPQPTSATSTPSPTESGSDLTTIVIGVVAVVAIIAVSTVYILTKRTNK